MNSTLLRRSNVSLVIKVQEPDYGSLGGPAGTDRYLHLKVCPLTMVDHKLVWPSDYGPVGGLANLGLVGQLDSVAARSTDQFYGLEPCYRDTYTVDLRRAETMHKTLRYIHTGLDRLTVAEGEPRDNAAAIIRFARVVKAFEYGIVATQGSWQSGTPTTYHWLDPDTLRDFLRREVAEWRSRHGVRVTA